MRAEDMLLDLQPHRLLLIHGIELDAKFQRTRRRRPSPVSQVFSQRLGCGLQGGKMPKGEQFDLQSIAPGLENRLEATVRDQQLPGADRGVQKSFHQTANRRFSSRSGPFVELDVKHIATLVVDQHRQPAEGRTPLLECESLGRSSPPIRRHGCRRRMPTVWRRKKAPQHHIIDAAIRF